MVELVIDKVNAPALNRPSTARSRPKRRCLLSNPDSTVRLKRCGRCSQKWPASPRYFYRTSGGKCAALGLYSICKACMAYPENRARILAEMAAPDGHRACSSCLEVFPATSRHFKHHSEGRLRRKCRACEVGPKRRTHERAKMDCPTGMMPCFTCMEVKPHTAEYFRVSAKGVVECQCLVCLRKSSAANLRKNRSENRAKYLSRERAYREANREQACAATKRYRAKHPERVRALRYTRKGAPGSHTAEDLIGMYDSQGGLCAYCESPMFDKWTVEHMTPVCRGGTNDWDNIALACGWCNSSKNDKTPEEYMEWLKGGGLNP